MTDDKKVVKLTKVVNEQVEAAYPTYQELITKHLSGLDDRRKNAQPVVMIITCLTEDGNMQEVLIGDCVAQAMGLLEITKQNLYLDSLGVLE